VAGWGGKVGRKGDGIAGKGEGGRRGRKGAGTECLDVLISCIIMEPPTASCGNSARRFCNAFAIRGQV
jgi:hypothetical protein